MVKDIADPVHGLIKLGQLEADILATRAMQRLHNIHQLGLAYLVFPGANYTRHAHSIGACHNAGRMLDAIRRNTAREHIAPHMENFEKYRVLALLHDIGHYPFSHATEHVIEDYYTSLGGGPSLFATSGSTGTTKSPPAPKEKQFYDHEEMGAYIIANDDEITSVLRKHSLDPVEIAERFGRKKPEFSALSGIISSELDCDRLDYLRRTAINSGAPYGSVDISFLIDQAVLDCEGNFCFRGKAARSADHLLISRFYDYMQVPFNKTAVALEWSLKQALRLVFKRKMIDPSASAMEAKVMAGTDWQFFDDQFVFGLFREIAKTGDLTASEADHLRAITCRRPAKLIASWDTLRSKVETSEKEKDRYTDHASRRKKLEGLVDEYCKVSSVDPDRIYVWENKIKFTKDTEDDANDASYFAEGVHILDTNDNRAKRLMKRTDMLVSRLNESYLSGLRVYYLPNGLGGKSTSELSAEFIEFMRTRYEAPTIF